MSHHFLRSGVALAIASGLASAAFSQTSQPLPNATLKEITITCFTPKPHSRKRLSSKKSPSPATRWALQT
jgi:hypothetical protein